MSVRVVKYRPFEKNTLRGFVDLRLTNTGLTIKECTYHEKNCRHWVGYPARPYQVERKRLWSPVIAFDDESHKGFQKQNVKAIQDYLNH